MCKHRVLIVVAVVGALSGCGGSEEKTALTPQSGAVTDPKCSELTVRECEENKHCLVIYGAEIDEEQHCAKEKQPVGCTDGAPGCDDSVQFIRDESGKLWQFPNTCTPSNWANSRLDLEAGNNGIWSDCAEK